MSRMKAFEHGNAPRHPTLSWCSFTVPDLAASMPKSVTKMGQGGKLRGGNEVLSMDSRIETGTFVCPTTWAGDAVLGSWLGSWLFCVFPHATHPTHRPALEKHASSGSRGL